MEKYTVKTIDLKAKWEDFVLDSNPKSFLQSWNWGETNKLLGSKIFRLGFYEKERLVGVCLIIKEISRRGTYFLIPGGPILDWANRDLVNTFVKEIKKLAKSQRAWFVRVRPELIDTQDHRKLFSDCGFIPAPMHLHAENTWILDISKSDEEILSGMRKTTRYLIRKSLKEGYIVERTTNLEKVKVLYKLQKETVERHKFVGFSEKLFNCQLYSFLQDNQSELYIVKKGKEAMAAAIIIYYGDSAYYHHSGSTSKYPKLSFSYFLQWQIVLEAKRRGLKYYNFWGVAPDDNPKHRFAGVTIFKKGFGGEQIDWLHAHDLPVSLFYWLTYVFENLRKKIRRL